MGREVRRVPKDWKHPKYMNEYRGECYRPMYDMSFEEALNEWVEAARLWYQGKYKDWEKGIINIEDSDPPLECFEKEIGSAPDPDWYMPEWTDEEKTHLMMYEDTTEGTPISPAFETPEELAQWLTDNDTSMFGSLGASYDAWLKIARGGYSFGVVLNTATGQTNVSVCGPEEEDN